MSNRNWSRRSFFGASAAAGAASLVHPAALAAQSAGIRTGDLPDLTIKEAKVYVTDIGDVRHLNSTENGEIVSLVTASGIEGNYSIGNRGNPPGWLDYAKAACVGKNVFDLLPVIAYGGGRRQGGGGGGGARGGAGAAPAGAPAGGRGGARGGAGAPPQAGARGGGGGGGAFGGGFGFAARRARQIAPAPCAGG